MRVLKPTLIVATLAVFVCMGLVTAQGSSTAQEILGLDDRENAVAKAPAFSGQDATKRIHLTPLEAMTAAEDGTLAGNLKSLLKVDRQLAYGEFLWDADGVPPGELLIRVDLRTQLMSVFQGGHEIGTAVILYGADSHMTPMGSFPIAEKNRDYHSRTYDAPMPYSLRLTEDGVAIHGSDVRRGSATHGCVGIPLEFASLLFEKAKQGDVVQIVRSPRDPDRATRLM